jgi:spore maturation protein CgeB
MQRQLRCLYLGIRTPGTTSRLRSDALMRALPAARWTEIDTDVPFSSAFRVWRSLAFRLRWGPAVRAINQYVLERLPSEPLDLVWVDKGVCLWPATVRRIRKLAACLVYYTPDTSFLHNSSRFFNRTVCLYDRVVTTKSLELGEFQRLVSPEKLVLTTQSYDQQLHFPRVSFADKRPEAVFIGLCEPAREECVASLLNAGVPVRIGGRGWESFLRRRQRDANLFFEGDAVFGDHYADVLSKASIGLGLVTRRFAELHTTRTFEIPACGTALATESSSEVSRIFGPGDAIFFRTFADLSAQCARLIKQPERLRQLTECGYRRVLDSGCNNDGMVRQVLEPLGFAVAENL